MCSKAISDFVSTKTYAEDSAKYAVANKTPVVWSENE